MKLLRTIFILIPVVLLIILNWQCSDTPTNSPVTKIKVSNDATREYLTFDVYEHQYVEPDGGGTPYYDYVNIASYSCNSCYNPPEMRAGDFQTADSIRDDGVNTITNLGYDFVTKAHWECESWDYAVRYDLVSGGDNYFELLTTFSGDPCIPYAGVFTGSLDKTAKYQYLPKNSPIHVDYGVAPIPPENKMTKKGR